MRQCSQRTRLAGDSSALWGWAARAAELASLNELILTVSGGNGARSPLLDHDESAARLR